MEPSVVVLLAVNVLTASQTPWPQVVEEATRVGKPIVVDVFAAWCEPCRALEKDVFSVSAVAQARSEKTRFVRYDAERGAGLEVASRYEVGALPSVLVFTPDGALIGRVSARWPERFLAELEVLLSIAKASGDPVDKPLDARLLYLGGLRALHGDPAKGVLMLERAAQLDADNLLGVHDRAAAAAVRARFIEEATALRARWLVELAKRAPGTAEAVFALNALGSLSVRPELAKLRGVIDEVRDAHTTTENSDQLSELISAQLTLRDVDGALATAKVLEGLEPTAQMLHSVAEAYFQAHQRERAVAIEEPLARDHEEFRETLSRFKTTEPLLPSVSMPDPLSMEAPSRPMKAAPDDVREAIELESTLADACRSSAKAMKSAFVRMTIVGPKVTRALAFDVETPPALKKCLELAASRQTLKSLGARSPLTMQVHF